MTQNPTTVQFPTTGTEDNEKKHFALIGAAGFVAPRHMQAIKDTGNELVAAVDPHDSVGILDRFFPQAQFFTEIERFDRHIEKRRRSRGGPPVDYVSVCSPNYLHDSHIRMALRSGASAICEKPLVVNPWNLDMLASLEEETGNKVYGVLQLRLHPAIIALKEKLEAEQNRERRKVELIYVSRRGSWYHHSWKGSPKRSGGVGMNIGIHFFDLLMNLFGTPQQSNVHVKGDSRMAGSLQCEHADISWMLSVDEEDLPNHVREEGGFAFRSLTLDGEEIDLSVGFHDLHTETYRHILAGKGFGLDEARPAIELVYNLYQQDVVTSNIPKELSHYLKIA